HGQSTDAVLTVPADAARLDLYYRVSSEEGFDFFRVLVDGDQVLEASGEVGWLGASVDVTGASTVTFRYVKDGSESEGSDAAWIDDLAVTLRYAASVTPTID